MDFYIDIGAAVILRVLRERQNLAKYLAVFLKLYNAIGRALVVAHVDAQQVGPTQAELIKR